MREYPVKKTIKMSNDYIIDVLKSEVGNYTVSNGHIISSFPGLKKLEVWADGKKLYMETETDTEYKNPSETIRKFNDLLEKLTGYNSKERKKFFSKLK